MKSPYENRIFLLWSIIIIVVYIILSLANIGLRIEWLRTGLNYTLIPVMVLMLYIFFKAKKEVIDIAKKTKENDEQIKRNKDAQKD